MPSRSRSKVSPPILGDFRRIASTVRQDMSSTVTSVESISDVVPGNFHNLYISKCKGSGATINGTSWTGGPTRIARDFMPHLMRDCTSSLCNPFTSIPGSPSDSAAITDVLARTNPSRPTVSLPLFIYELKELPDLFRREYGGLIRKAASNNLKYQFAIKPLVSDLMGLFNFGQHVRNRTVELEHLFKSGLRRKRIVFEGSVDTRLSDVTMQSLHILLHYNGVHVSREKVWGYVEWVPTSTPPKTDAELLNLARRAALGLTIDPATAWNAIPWSWLVDWCSNVGDYLSAYQNIVGASPRNMVVMRHRRSETKWSIASYDNVYPGIVFPDNTYTRETKSRQATSPSLSAYLPFLSGRQLSILGSLAILRGKTRVHQ